MSINEMFVIATKNKFRFPYRGFVSVEDLWDLTLEQLDTVFKTLNSQYKAAQEESLLTVKSKEDKQIELMIDIVKYVVLDKQAEIEKRKSNKERKEKKQRILEVMYAKQEEEIRNKSTEELQKMLDDLDEEE